MEQIKNLINKELETIYNPDTNEIFHFNHLDELVDFLVFFIEFPCNEPKLDNLGTKVIGAFNSFAQENIDVHNLTLALEDLATGFESFLKKIAIYKFKDSPELIYGDGTNYLGLISTTLGSILRGKVAKKDPRNRSIPELNALTVNFNSSSQSISNVIYTYSNNLRNEIHLSPSKSIFDLIKNFQYITAAYLFALEENIKILRSLIDPKFINLEKLKRDFILWESNFIELESKEKTDNTFTFPNLEVSEWQDSITDDGLLPSLPTVDNEFEEINIESPEKKSVIDLFQHSDTFWLIGEPGSGKTTTLQSVAFQRAKEILDLGYINQNQPVFIKANIYHRKFGFKKQITELLGINPSEFDSLIQNGEILILIDGINEIPELEYEFAVKEIKQLINRFPEINLVLSSRKYGFLNHFNIPVYELLPLTDEMIISYLEKNLPQSLDANNHLRNFLYSNSQLMELARNPLLLQMLSKILFTGNLPTNQGQLFKQFTDWIISREEQKKTTKSQKLLFEKILSVIGYKIRLSGKLYSHKTEILQWISDSLSSWNSNENVDKIFSYILDIHILEVDKDANIRFFHEQILEYYCSLELINLYLNNKIKIERISEKTNWFESIILMAGLIDDPNKLILSIYKKNIVLAARCISSSNNISEQTIKTIIDAAAFTILENPTSKNRLNSTIALLEIGNNDAFSIIIKSFDLKGFSWSLTTALKNTVRPEMTTIKLLGFGLTSKKRIRQCLIVFKNQYTPASILNSDEIANAQLSLLEYKNIVSKDITLLSKIGLSQQVLPHAKSIMKKILKNKQLSNPLWNNAVLFSEKFGFLPEFKELILDRIADYESTKEPYTFYSIWIALKTFGFSEKTKNLAMDISKFLMGNELLVLAAKYISTFELSQDYSKEFISDYLYRAATTGRIGQLIECKPLFETLYDFEPLFEIALIQLLTEKKPSAILAFKEVFYPIIENIISEESNKNKLLNLNTDLSPKALKNFITELGINNHFSDYGVVKTYFPNRGGYGFVINLETGSDLYFHNSIMKKENRNFISVGKIVKILDVTQDAKYINQRIKKMILVHP